MSDIDPSGQTGDPGAAAAAPAPAQNNPPQTPYVPPATGGQPANPDATTPGDPAFAGISPDDLILNPSDGHLYGFKRTIEVAADGKTVYGYKSLDLGDASDETKLGAIATAAGIPLGVLQVKYTQLARQNAQTQSQGYGKVIGFDPSTGLFTYQKPDGTRATTSNVADLGSVGIAPNEIKEAQAQAGTTGRTLTQMGQYTVAGMMPDGSLQVRDFNGNLSTFTAQQAAAGQIPGVSYSDFQRAQSEFATNQRTITQAGQFTIQGRNANGTYNVVNFNGQVTQYSAQQLQQAMAAGQLPGVTQSAVTQADAEAYQTARTNTQAGQFTLDNAQFDQNGNLVFNVKNFNGQITPYSGAQLQQALAAGTLPGVSFSDVQQAQYHAQDVAWQLSPVNTPAQNSYAYFGNGYGNAPTTPPVPNPTPPPQGGGTPGINPNPTPPPQGGATPGATPNPTPPYGATPATPGATPNPTPTPYSATSSTPQTGMMTQGAGASNTLTTAQDSAASASGQQQTAGGGKYSSTSSSPKIMSLSPQQQASYGAYAQTAATPGVITHQQQQQNNQAYQQNLSQTTATNAGQSRNMSGLGWSGIQQPRVAGY